ncbi:hypothetical protein SAMN05414139_04971 [Burkholderia sp. D7]|nr:hypothetical protein SAMN05414139_04971 [Burkholderia sp. D7]
MDRTREEKQAKVPNILDINIRNQAIRGRPAFHAFSRIGE